MVVTARRRRRKDAYVRSASSTSILVALTAAGALFLTVATLSAVDAAPSLSPGPIVPAAPALETEQEAPPSPGAHGRLWFADRQPVAAEGVLGATTDADQEAADAAAAAATEAAATSTVPGIWHRTAATAPWEWTPLAPELLTRWVYDGADAPPSPAWPSEVARLQAQHVVRPDGDALGYWVWNPSVFVGGTTGTSGTGGSSSHFWSPRWQWAPTGQPLLLSS